MVRRVSIGARELVERLLAIADLPDELRGRADELLARGVEPDPADVARLFLAAAARGLYEIEERWREGGQAFARLARRGGGHGPADRLTIPLPDDDGPRSRSLPLPLPAAHNLASEVHVRGLLRLYDELLCGPDVTVSHVHGVLELLRDVVAEVTGADAVTLAVDRAATDPDLQDEPVPDEPPLHPDVAEGVERALRERSLVVIEPLRAARPGEGAAWRSVAIVPARLPLGSGTGLVLTLQAWSAAASYWTPERLRVLGLFAALPADLVRQSRRVRELAFVDAMTGVLGRRFFELQLAHELGRAKREEAKLALCIVDVDDFKQFNARFSHTGGDKALRHVARVLQERLRGSDWVARIGGDEFAFVLASNVTIESAEAVAARICDALAAEGCRDLPGAPHVTVTIGGALFPDDEQEADALHRCASEAALEQKKRQKGRAGFHGRPPRPGGAPAAG